MDEWNRMERAMGSGGTGEWSRGELGQWGNGEWKVCVIEG